MLMKQPILTFLSLIKLSRADYYDWYYGDYYNSYYDTYYDNYYWAVYDGYWDSYYSAYYGEYYLGLYDTYYNAYTGEFYQGYYSYDSSGCSSCTASEGAEEEEEEGDDEEEEEVMMIQQMLMLLKVKNLKLLKVTVKVLVLVLLLQCMMKLVKNRPLHGAQMIRNVQENRVAFILMLKLTIPLLKIKFGLTLEQLALPMKMFNAKIKTGKDGVQSANKVVISLQKFRLIVMILGVRVLLVR